MTDPPDDTDADDLLADAIADADGVEVPDYDPDDVIPDYDELGAGDA